MPFNKEKVYSAQVTIKIRRVSSLTERAGKIFCMISAIRGVATEKVVAVPARRANIAKISIPFPKTPSVFSFKIALQASE